MSKGVNDNTNASCIVPKKPGAAGIMTANTVNERTTNDAAKLALISTLNKAMYMVIPINIHCSKDVAMMGSNNERDLIE